MKLIPRESRRSTVKMTVGLPLKCVVVGDDMAGKTSMIASYTTGSILDEHLPTVFRAFNLHEDNHKSNEYLAKMCGSILTVVDTANQDHLQKRRIDSYTGCDVILVCYPVVCRQSADDIRTRWLPELKQYAPKVPYLLVGTKADLRMDPETIESQGLDYIMTKEEGYSLAKNVGAQGYVECSAIEHVGLEEVFEKTREVARFGHLRGLSSHLYRRRNSRTRARNFFKYFLCGKPKGSSNVR